MIEEPDDEEVCPHCIIMELLSERIDAGTSPTDLLADLTQCMAEFLSWNGHERGRLAMLATVLTKLPLLLVDAVEEAKEAMKSRRRVH